MRAILFVFAFVLAGAHARAEDNPACAKFVEPLAYNACLARLGPQAAAPRGVPEPRGVRVKGVVAARRTQGRMRMEFTVTPR
jgi:hypothetical protein